MSDTYLVDSNIWIGHSMAYPDAVNYIDDELIGKGKTIAINTVIQMELLSHQDIENPAVRVVFENYIYRMLMKYMTLTKSLPKKAGQIRRLVKVAGRKVLKGPDA